ncbi:MAG: recombinase RecA [Isosphaeraceae bacterium]
MAVNKKGGGGKLPPPPSTKLVVDADEVRSRIAKLTSSAAVPDPLAVRKFNVNSTGFLQFDYALRVGGLREGAVHAFEGENASGKTGLVAAIQGSIQRIKRQSVHAFLDVEGTATEAYLELCGVDTSPDRFILFKPESAEEAMEIAMALIGYTVKEKRWQRDLSITPVTTIAYDSWAGSPVDTTGMAGLARVGAEWWPRLSTKASRTGTTIFAINQLRTKPGVTFGNPQYGAGGDAFKYAQTSRLWVTKMGVIKDEKTNEKLSHDVKVSFEKMKSGRTHPPIHLHFNNKTGFDYVVDAFRYFELRGVSFKEKDGKKYSWKYQTEDGFEEIQGVGIQDFLQELRTYPEVSGEFIRQARVLAAQDDEDSRALEAE